ncbi:hypothetical protein EO087_07200 [Dyella sp. M7H15-1]|uniref:hypothetical protein n=1 Tax=Dyella sp. M7H15-1 TaxID=2501295 RepID=UPI001004F8F1|nr:hypothetical protein [Dyella sp. M7H15-1]QAU23797.1 hypothetical protein EO087_07200 [Dyella sp. M7H15-1]
MLSLAAVAYNILRLMGQQALLGKDAPLTASHYGFSFANKANIYSHLDVDVSYRNHVVRVICP